MDLSHLVIQVLVALVCAIAANILIPRDVPGRFAGLVVIGLIGVLVGEWVFNLLKDQYGLDYPLLHWSIQKVPIVPSIIGSAIVLYVTTAMLRWGRYSR